MSCGAYPSATVRIMDIKRFVQDFIRDYKPAPEGIKTPLDVFTWVFCEVYNVFLEKEGCEELDPDDPNRNGCEITYSGTGTYPTWWCYDGFLNFFRWCIPYVEEKTAYFQNQVEVWESTAWRMSTRFGVGYKIADGQLVETDPHVTEGMGANFGVAAPKVSEIIKCLEKRHPHATRENARYVIRFGAFAEEAVPRCNGGRRVLDLEEFEKEYDAGIDELIDELHDDELDDDDRPCGRMFYSFEMRFKKSKREGVRDVSFLGTMFDWNRYVVYDEGLTPDDLAAAIAKHVTVKTRRECRARQIA